jgi:UDP-N-acetylmuramyl pentapeptide synthase
VIPLSLAVIAEITGARPHLVTDPAAIVDTVVIDSRAAGPGTLFAALPGRRVDGLDFAPAAVAAGAVAVLATRPAGVPTLVVPDVPAAMAALASAVVARLPGLTIAGITGSAGKTTTKDLAAQLVERLGPTVSPRGSFNNEIGHPLTILRVTAATRYLLLELSRVGRAISPGSARSHGHRWASCCASAGHTPASSAAWRRWRGPKASCPRPCPPTAWPCSTPMTRGCWPWPGAPRPGW